ncbi:RDD family protein [Mangrovihabitans endophyticus]|uniref:RDD family protein n=1 Tax=Mangrovihabitans endophyticus TaxID=1751298 RepID=A0A8J3C337_9ACTN|nr:RDD family protein [Mangrovihabitans endophyticus]GGL02901.1 hypothetical protein GCM10012284_41880 [Mangrovihabitans endophyticus]
MSSLPPGWYKDPADTSTQRYWDGDGWVGRSLPVDAAPPDGPLPEEPPAEPTLSSDAGPSSGAPAALPGWHPGAPAQQPPGGHRPGLPGPPTPPTGGDQPSRGSQPLPGWMPPPGMPMIAARPHGFALAGFGPRLVARILDVLAVLVLNVVVNGYFLYQFAQEFAPYWRAAVQQAANGNAFGEQPQPTSRMQNLMWAMLIIATLLWLLYEAPAIANRGQTIGKRIMHIRVMAVEHTDPIGFGRAFRRWARLGLWTPLWGCAGLGFLLQLIDCASPLFDQQLRQALHDKTARTVVVEFPPDARPTVGASHGGGSSEGQG